MNSSWGRQVVYSLFGESHGPMIGITLHHLPAGIALDLTKVRQAMDERRPGRDGLSTPRRESDQFELVSGMKDGHTTGAPLTVLIPNTNQRSGDYEKVLGIVRPSHADYAAYIKYGGYQDPRGGGHFSGRLTAPIVFAGAVAEQLLASTGVTIRVEVEQIGTARRKKSGLGLTEEMQQAILDAKRDADSIGGRIRVEAVGVPAGWGEPFFHSVESVLSQLFYSIPGVKGVLFGAGEAFADSRGSMMNDPLEMRGEEIVFLSNNNGGINGGITNGEPVVASLIFKPTPSIGKIQKTVDLEHRTSVDHVITGRHDPCIIPRARPVVKAMMAIGLLELMMTDRAGRGI